MHKVLIVAAAVVALSAAPSYASQTQVLSDCNQHAALTHTYTLSDLRGALATMPTPMKEYTNCSDVIQRAIIAQIGSTNGSGNTSGSSGGSFLPTPVIIILIALALAAGGYAVMAVRRRGEPGDGEPPDEPPQSG
jgi:hypothetical protein